ncbi:MAG: hypothetical protein FJ098_04835, partial [Deltaproteobacteria bacterium]|nr:hypothetical protein [Deltaproteobacteria bacterium]
ETDVRVPLPPWREEDRFLAAVTAVARREGVDLFLPNNSVEAAIYARRRAELPAPVFLPSQEAFAAGESKWLAWQRFRDAGLPVPRTELLGAPDDVRRVFDALETRPVWVRGAGIPGRGVGVASLPCRTPAQAEQWVDYWNGWGGMIASEFLPGDNLTWLGVFREGRLVASQGRQRDAYVIPHVSPSGITGAPAICHTVQREDINILGPRAVRAVDPRYTGPAFVDFKADAEGTPRITEINVGRFGTTHHFYSVAGANFPMLVVALALGRPLPGWVREHDVLPAGLYWIRTLDAGPVLVREEALGDAGVPGAGAGA